MKSELYKTGSTKIHNSCLQKFLERCDKKHDQHLERFVIENIFQQGEFYDVVMKSYGIYSFHLEEMQKLAQTLNTHHAVRYHPKTIFYKLRFYCRQWFRTCLG